LLIYMDAEITYTYESKTKFIIMVACVMVAIVFIFNYMFVHRKITPNIYDPIDRFPVSIDAATIIVCIPEKYQLENLNILINDTFPRFVNIPVNPTLKESKIDGTMVQKATTGNRILYKIQLPREYKIKEISLDMYVDEEDSVYIFVENFKNKRVWEKNIKVSRGRFHKVSIYKINI
jgi:hypothetical protein